MPSLVHGPLVQMTDRPPGSSDHITHSSTLHRGGGAREMETVRVREREREREIERGMHGGKKRESNGRMRKIIKGYSETEMIRGKKAH